MVFQWWGDLRREAKPRRAISRNHMPDKIIYTDSATETMIFPIGVFGKRDFDAAGFISDAYHGVESGEWVALSPGAMWIYGQELSASAQTAADPRVDFDHKQVAFYIDNNNAQMALIKSDSKRRIIAISVRASRDIISRRGSAPRFERASSDYNIADRPTRYVILHYRIKNDRIPPFRKNLLRMVSEAALLRDMGFFDPDEIVGRHCRR